MLNSATAFLIHPPCYKKHFPTLKFEYIKTTDSIKAVESIISFINGDFPVLVSVSHARVAGHIILIVGYENYEAGMCTPDFRLVVHDPYGKFDPSLMSQVFGKQRWKGGMCLQGGGEVGPGKAVRLHLDSVGRRRQGDGARGAFYLLSATNSTGPK